MTPPPPKPRRVARADEQTVASEFGERMRVARKSAELTLRDVSEETGISITYLSDLERGALANPTLDKLVLIARALRVPIARLVGAHDEFDRVDEEVPAALQELTKMPQFVDAIAVEAKRWRTTPHTIEREWVNALRGFVVLGRRPSQPFDYLFIFEAVRRAIEKS